MSSSWPSLSAAEKKRRAAETRCRLHRGRHAPRRGNGIHGRRVHRGAESPEKLAPRRCLELAPDVRTAEIGRGRGARSECRRRARSLRRRSRRGDAARHADQGRRRGAHSREDHCGGIPALHLHRRRQQAGRSARRLPPAGRGDTHGPLLRRERAREARRTTRLARRSDHRQRQSDPGRSTTRSRD